MNELTNYFLIAKKRFQCFLLRNYFDLTAQRNNLKHVNETTVRYQLFFLKL